MTDNERKTLIVTNINQAKSEKNFEVIKPIELIVKELKQEIIDNDLILKNEILDKKVKKKIKDRNNYINIKIKDFEIKIKALEDENTDISDVGVLKRLKNEKNKK